MDYATAEEELKEMFERGFLGATDEKMLRNVSNNYRWREFDFSDCDIDMTKTEEGRPLVWSLRAEIEFCYMKTSWFLSQRHHFGGKPLCDALLLKNLQMPWPQITAPAKLSLMRCLRSWLRHTPQKQGARLYARK